MRRVLVFVLLILFIDLANAAQIIKSCDEKYSANLDHGLLSIERSSKIVSSYRIDHGYSGGAFTLDGSLLVIFGVPNKINSKYPQVTKLSVFRVGKKIRPIMKEIYGGVVYEAAFSSDQRFVAVQNQYGVDILDLTSKTSKSFGVTHEIDFSTQKCQ